MKKIYVECLSLNINNHNLNDIRRILALMQWHNSFVEIPQHLWVYKPPFQANKRSKEVLSNISRLRYLVKIIDYKLRENKSVRAILQQRRKYLQIYDDYNQNPTEKKKFEL